MALLMYDEVRNSPSPKSALLECMESAYLAGAKTANWDIEDFRAQPVRYRAAGEEDERDSVDAHGAE